MNAVGRMIGIDLGTTNSVIAVMDGPRPRILTSREGHDQTPSVVSVKRSKSGESRLLVGTNALKNWEMAPKDTVLSIKRLMGRGFGDEQVQEVRKYWDYEVRPPSNGTKDSLRVMLDGRERSPVEISAEILKKLKSDAEFRLKQPVTHAVITVPAYFSQAQKAATREAGNLAGLRVIKLLEEPTAAAIAVGLDRAADGGEPPTVLVYDFGGGTFDISVLLWAGGVFAPLNLEGNMWLGGDNMDRVLVDRAVRYVRDEYDHDVTSDNTLMVKLKGEARAAKEQLTTSQTASIMCRFTNRQGDIIDAELELTQKEFEDAIRSLVQRTVKLTEKALEGAHLKPSDVNYVVMAGSSTNVPMVQQAIEKMFGKEKVLRDHHPKHCVALGAAIVANAMGGIVCQAPDPNHPDDPKRECGSVNEYDARFCARCHAELAPRAGIACGCGFLNPEDATDCEKCGNPLIVCVIPSSPAPFDYGVQTAGDRFNVFIKKNDPYPTDDPQPQTFYTRRPNERMISIPVYGGQATDRASANEKQGDAFALLPPGLPEGYAVLITLWLDRDGVFDLSARLPDGTPLNPWIIKGEADALAVELLLDVEQALAGAIDGMDRAQRDEIEADRNRVFDLLRRARHEEAMRKARELLEKIRTYEPSGPPSLETKANSLIGYTEMLLDRYSWALDPSKTYQLTTLVEETRSALQSTDMVLMEKKVGELDTATDHLPQSVHLLLGMQGAIRGRLKPSNPAAADRLSVRLEEVERSFKANKAQEALSTLAALAKELQDELDKITPPDRAVPCHSCGQETHGKLVCPSCKANQSMLVTKSPGGGAQPRR